jgi:hypothetical protein
MIGIDVNERIKFQSKHETNQEQPTIFVLRILSYSERLEYAELFTMGKGTMPKIGELVQKSLVRIENIYVGRKLTDFEEINEEAMNCIPPKVFAELANKITVLNGLAEDESKN